MPSNEQPVSQEKENGQMASDSLLESNQPAADNMLDYLLSILGFGICRAWIIFCLSVPLVGNLFNTFLAPEWIFLTAGALTTLLVSFLVSRLVDTISHVRLSLLRAAAVFLVLSACIIPLSLSFNVMFLALIGFIIGGIGAGLLQILWGERFAHYEIRFAAVVSPAAAIATALLVALSSTGTNIAGFIVLPLLSYVFLLVVAHRTGVNWRAVFPVLQKNISSHSADMKDTAGADTGDTSEEASEKTGLSSDIIKLMFSIMIFSFLCRMYDSLTLTMSDPFGLFGGSAIFALVVVGSAFLFISVVLKNRFNATFTYRLSLPLMIAGFVALALFFDSHAAYSLLLINIGYEFFDILSWILFTEVSRRKKAIPLQIFGLGVAFTFTGMALGYLFGNIISSLVTSGDLQITVVVLLSILSLVVVAFMVISEETISQLMTVILPDKKDSEVSDMSQTPGELENEVPHILKSSLETNCVLVAKEYRLTPRESEVLVLLAYGRTLNIIARDLQIAKGTARTHIENIYRKLDVHKQQELIDLVEEFLQAK